MKGVELARLLDRALARLERHSEELRELDAALGDGDLGVTVSNGAAAVRKRLASLGDAVPAKIIKTAGATFASANPSTLAALVGGGLLAAGKKLGDADAMDDAQALQAARAAAESIQVRGKAKLGDKTILDALLPSLDAAEAAPEGKRLNAAIEAAERGIAESAGQQSRRGRAAWLRERSAGQKDAGAVAYLRFLEALRDEIAPEVA